MFIATLATVFVALAAPATAPTTAPVNMAALVREARESIEGNEPRPPLVGSRPLDDVISIADLNGRILCSTKMAQTDGPVAVPVPGLEEPVRVTVARTADEEKSLQFVQMQHVIYGREGQVSSRLQVFARGEYFQLAWDQKTLGGERSVQLIQVGAQEAEAGARVKLFFQKFDAGGELISKQEQIVAPDLPSLVAAHPEEFARFVLRPLRERSMHVSLVRPSQAVAWQVLGPLIPPSDTARDRVAKLVPQLDSEAFAEREAASRQLLDMAGEGASILAKVDTSVLSLEQRQAIESILARYEQLPAAEVESLRSRPLFLIGCLYGDDDRVALAAVQRLGQVTGSEIPLEAMTNPAARRALADELLGRLVIEPAIRSDS